MLLIVRFSFLVVLINQVYDNLLHRIFLFRPALGDHQGQGNQGIVGNTLRPVLIVKNAVAVEKPQEQSGGNTFVAIAERMVLGDKIEQHGCLLFY